MKTYPSIPHCAGPMPECIGFYKYDGSNIRAQWSRKSGWYKYGTRNRLFDHHDPEYAPAIEIFNKKYAEPLEKMFKEHKEYRGTESALAFCEFFGPHSFSGQHSVESLNYLGFGIESNEPKDLILFDISIHKRGFVNPFNFVRHFNHLDIAKVIYEGHLTEEFIEDVKNGKYPVREGVVVKGGYKTHELWMVKIKTRSYLDELKQRWKVDWKNHW